MPRHRNHHKRRNRREARALKEHAGAGAPSFPELDEEQLEAASAGVAALVGPWDAMESTLSAIDDDEDEEQDAAAPSEPGEAP
jgi:hypothetical protein